MPKAYSRLAAFTRGAGHVLHGVMGIDRCDAARFGQVLARLRNPACGRGRRVYVGSVHAVTDAHGAR
jgi:hypothetical protein